MTLCGTAAAGTPAFRNRQKRDTGTWHHVGQREFLVSCWEPMEVKPCRQAELQGEGEAERGGGGVVGATRQSGEQGRLSENPLVPWAWQAAV